MATVLRHINLFKITSGVSPQDYGEFIKAYSALDAVIPEVQNLALGVPIARHSNKGYELGAVVDFKSETDLAAFYRHPYYVQVMQTYRGRVFETKPVVFDMWGITKEIYDADPSVMSGLEAVKEAKAPIEAILEQPIINGNAKSNEIDQHPVGKTKDGKLYHIVLCMLQEGFTAEIYDKFMKTMVDMEPALTSHGLISCLIGKPLSNAQAHNHLFGFVCELATEEDLNYYLYHKLHIDMIMSNGGVSYDWNILWMDFWNTPDKLDAEKCVKNAAMPPEPKPHYH